MGRQPVNFQLLVEQTMPCPALLPLSQGPGAGVPTHLFCWMGVWGVGVKSRKRTVLMESEGREVVLRTGTVV